jgi:hypothetical protein
MPRLVSPGTKRVVGLSRQNINNIAATQRITAKTREDILKTRDVLMENAQIRRGMRHSGSVKPTYRPMSEAAMQEADARWAPVTSKMRRKR